MYVVSPSSDTATSCGSLPAGTRATIFRLEGSTITKVSCSFSRTSSAAAGVFAACRAAAPRQTSDSRCLVFIGVLSNSSTNRDYSNALAGSGREDFDDNVGTRFRLFDPETPGCDQCGFQVVEQAKLIHGDSLCHSVAGER